MSGARPSFITTAIQERQRARDELQKQVDAFLAKGGKIQYLAQGESSSLSAEDIKVARRKERLRQPRAKKREEE